LKTQHETGGSCNLLACPVCLLLGGRGRRYKIETKYGNHHPGFTEFCGKPQNFEVTRVAAKAIAGTAVDMLSDHALVDAAKAAFEEQKKTAILWEPTYVDA